MNERTLSANNLTRNNFNHAKKVLPARHVTVTSAERTEGGYHITASVPSWTTADRAYQVSYDSETEEYSCHCTAFNLGGGCWHAARLVMIADALELVGFDFQPAQIAEPSTLFIHRRESVEARNQRLLDELPRELKTPYRMPVHPNFEAPETIDGVQI